MKFYISCDLSPAARYTASDRSEYFAVRAFRTSKHQSTLKKAWLLASKKPGNQPLQAGTLALTSRHPRSYKLAPYSYKPGTLALTSWHPHFLKPGTLAYKPGTPGNSLHPSNITARRHNIRLASTKEQRYGHKPKIFRTFLSR